MDKMTSATPTSESTSPVPNVLAYKSTITPGESSAESKTENKSESWENKIQASSVDLVAQKFSTNITEDSLESNASLGFESGGKKSGDIGTFSEKNSGAVSPNCLKWAESLQILLSDVDGLNLFQQYLEQEDPDRYHMLEFWLACKGLSKQPPNQAHQLVKVIYKQLFLKAQLSIDDEIRKSVTLQVKDAAINNRLLSAAIFNDARKNVEKVMNSVVYPNFLSSEIYLNYVQKMQGDTCNIGGNSSEAPGSPREAPAVPEEPYDELPENNRQPPLPVVEEDEELFFPTSKSVQAFNVEKRRLGYTRLPPDSFPKKFLQHTGYPRYLNPPRRLHHYSYNPVSRQDSELQSLSSDARTDSMSDLSIDDLSCNRETYTYKKQFQRQMRQMKENANINQLSDTNFKLIPRTSNPGIKELVKPQDPRIFAEILTQKLEKVQKERDSIELMAQKLNMLDSDHTNYSASSTTHHEITDVSHHKIDDEDQTILDNHVSRIWSDITPRRSPSIGTPVRPKSPDGKKLWPPYVPTNKIISHTSSTVGRVLHSFVGPNSSKKKDKDVYSLFSNDSGNGTDPAESLELHHHRSNVVRSKSTSQELADQAVAVGAHLPCARNVNRTWSSSRRTLSDSGVSVISGGGRAEYVKHETPFIQCRDKNDLVTSWLSESKKLSEKKATCSVISEERDSTISSSSKHRMKSSQGGYNHGSSKSRTGLPDRNVLGVTSSRHVLPSQPFVADPSMPPFPFHTVDTDTQLEETRRRLNEMEQKTNRFVSGASSMSRSSESSFSGVCCQNVLKTDIPTQKHLASAQNIFKPSSVSSFSDKSSFTTVVYNFSDEKMPYLSRIPGSPITFKQFKEYMPKKGHYRYFFVTSCEELGMRPIQEEITDDNQLLPLWKGKVNAQIKLIE